MEDPKQIAERKAERAYRIREMIRHCVEMSIPFVSQNPFKNLLKRSTSEGVKQYIQLEIIRDAHKRAVLLGRKPDLIIIDDCGEMVESQYATLQPSNQA